MFRGPLWLSGPMAFCGIYHTIYVSFTEVTSDAEPKSRFSYQIAVLADSAKKITMIYYGRLQEPF